MGKHLPNSCESWKKCNSYGQNINTVSDRRHCWTLWCYFISVKWKMRALERETKQVTTAFGSWKPIRFPTFLCIYCICQVKDVGTKSSWRDFVLKFFQLLSTLVVMIRKVTDSSRLHAEMILGKKLNSKLLLRCWSAPCMAATTISVWIIVSHFSKCKMIIVWLHQK